MRAWGPCPMMTLPPYHTQGSLLSCIRPFAGDWCRGQRTGHGLWTDGAGLSYEGGFEDGVFHGWGVLTEGGGMRYQGEFERGQRHGVRCPCDLLIL